jgi:hypothetical protein
VSQTEQGKNQPKIRPIKVNQASLRMAIRLRQGNGATGQRSQSESSRVKILEEGHHLLK